MNYDSIGPGLVLVPSARNRDLTLQGTRVSPELEDRGLGKNVSWSLTDLDFVGGGRWLGQNWQPESTDPTFPVSTAQSDGGGVMMWGMFS